MIQFAIALALAGLGLVALASGLSADNQMLAEVLRALGTTLFAIGAVSVFYEYISLRRTLTRYYDILARSRDAELESLFVDRVQAMQDILQEMERANGLVKVCAVAATDFLGDSAGITVISNLIKDNANVMLRFLLMDPDGKLGVGRIRAWIEESYEHLEEDQSALDTGEVDPDLTDAAYKKTWLYQNLRIALGTVERLCKDIDEANPKRVPRPGLRGSETAPETPAIACRLYQNDPSVFVVAVNRWVYVEPYHWGAAGKSSRAIPCLGKRVVVMKFRRKSDNGTAFENHFDRLWRCAKTKRFCPSEEREAELGADADAVNSEGRRVGQLDLSGD